MNSEQRMHISSIPRLLGHCLI